MSIQVPGGGGDNNSTTGSTVGVGGGGEGYSDAGGLWGEEDTELIRSCGALSSALGNYQLWRRGGGGG